METFNKQDLIPRMRPNQFHMYLARIGSKLSLSYANVSLVVELKQVNFKNHHHLTLSICPSSGY